MDWYFVKLSWKNIWRNKRRTLLTINAIGFGVMALVALHNYYDGFHEQVIHNVIRYQSGHLVISYPGYHLRNNPQLFVKTPKKIDKWLKEQDTVKNFSHRVALQGMVSTAYGSANIGIVGVEPQREKEVTKFSSNMISGKYFAEKGKGKTKVKAIVIGKELAKVLKAEVGTKVVVLTQGIDGSIGNELFFVEGIFKTQSDADKGLAFIPIEDARQILSLPKTAVHQIAVVLKSETDLGQVRDAFRGFFGAPSEAMLLVESWKDLQKPVMAMIELNKSANRLLMFIILFVAALGIANSVLMSILERTREFGVMFAIGTTKAEVMRFVMVETMLLGLVGVILGNVLGLGLTMYFGEYGFDLAWLTSQKLVVQGSIVQTVSYPKIHWMNSASVSMTVLAFSFIVSIIPLRYISRLQPVKALRAV